MELGWSKVCLMKHCLERGGSEKKEEKMWFYGSPSKQSLSLLGFKQNPNFRINLIWTNNYYSNVYRVFAQLWFGCLLLYYIGRKWTLDRPAHVREMSCHYSHASNINVKLIGWIVLDICNICYEEGHFIFDARTKIFEKHNSNKSKIAAQQSLADFTHI